MYAESNKSKMSPANVPSVNVSFSAVIIQYEPVQRKRSFLGSSPCASETRARPCLLRTIFRFAGGANPRKLYGVVGLVRGSPCCVPAFRRERGVVVSVLVRRLPRSSAPLPVCVNSELGTLPALRLLTRMPSGTLWLVCLS